MSALPRFPHPADMPAIYGPDPQCEPLDGYGEDDAEGDIASELIAADEVGELVSDVRRSGALLEWIASHVDLPKRHLETFRILDRRVRSIDRRVDELCEANA